jgi:hypothetical protein
MERITEDYVSFETAKLLKEKGFDENTICKYADVGGITEKWYDDYRERVLRFDWDEGYLIEPPIEPKDQYEIIGDTISAPNLQMAMKWLREVHRLFICVEIGVGGYTWNITNTTDYVTVYVDATVGTYEKACEAAIKYCLENII